MIQSISCVILFCLILLLRQGLAVLEPLMQEGVTLTRDLASLVLLPLRSARWDWEWIVTSRLSVYV